MSMDLLPWFGCIYLTWNFNKDKINYRNKAIILCAWKYFIGWTIPHWINSASENTFINAFWCKHPSPWFNVILQWHLAGIPIMQAKCYKMHSNSGFPWLNPILSTIYAKIICFFPPNAKATVLGHMVLPSVLQTLLYVTLKFNKEEFSGTHMKRGFSIINGKQSLAKGFIPDMQCSRILHVLSG